MEPKPSPQSSPQSRFQSSESKFGHLPITYKRWEPGTCKIADCYYI